MVNIELNLRSLAILLQKLTLFAEHNLISYWYLYSQASCDESARVITIIFTCRLVERDNITGWHFCKVESSHELLMSWKKKVGNYSCFWLPHDMGSLHLSKMFYTFLVNLWISQRMFETPTIYVQKIRTEKLTIKIFTDCFSITFIWANYWITS